MSKKNKGPTATELLSAIRKKCMDCSGGMRNEVRDCRIKDCPLYPYRRNALDVNENIQTEMEMTTNDG